MTGSSPRTGRRRDQFIALGWLVVVWNLLWGQFSPANLLTGLLVGGAVLLFFPSRRSPSAAGCAPGRC